MPPKRILIVEDDEDILEMISYNLEKEGYSTSFLTTGDGVEHAIGSVSPDLVLLDIMLPGKSGMDVLNSLRGTPAYENMPVIMLTAKSREADKVIGLELGADDYITKPFSPRELLARIKAVLRRSGQPEDDNLLRSGEMLIDSRKLKVTVSGEPVALTSTEFRMLELMARHPGEVFTRERILDAVFGYQSDAYERTVDTHVKTLRKKLGVARDAIETVRGAGYRFREQ